MNLNKDKHKHKHKDGNDEAKAMLIFIKTGFYTREGVYSVPKYFLLILKSDEAP